MTDEEKVKTAAKAIYRAARADNIKRGVYKRSGLFLEYKPKPYQARMRLMAEAALLAVGAIAGPVEPGSSS